MAEPIYGSTFQEDFAARWRMLPQATGAAMPAQARSAYDPEAQLEELLRQRTALEQQQPDMSVMQEFARKQGEMGQGALLNALAAQYAGESFQPLQTKFLRRAEAAQQPMKVGGGILTPTGDFVRDPVQAQERESGMLDRRIGQVERVIDSREARRMRAEQAQREEDLRRELGLGNIAVRQAGVDARAAARSAADAVGGVRDSAASNRQFQQATTLRGEYTRRADKVAEGVRHAETVTSLLNDPTIARDPTKQVSLIFAFGKLLDPESVVRESEYALIANARGLMDSLAQIPERVRTGARISPSQLASMRQVASSLYSGAGDRRTALADFYRDIAKRQGLRVEDVLPGSPGAGAPGVVDFNTLPK
jgi:hypothetical protein